MGSELQQSLAFISSNGHGCRLYKLLMKNFPFNSNSLHETFLTKIDRSISADGSYMESIYHTSIMYLLKRAIYTCYAKSKSIDCDPKKPSHFEDPNKSKKLREYILKYYSEILRINPDDIDMAIELTFESLKNSNKDFSTSVADEIYGPARNKDLHCYIGGSKLDLNMISAERVRGNHQFNSAIPELDHVWPRSMGGMTVIDNCRPASATYNNAKSEFISYFDTPWICYISKTNSGDESHEKVFDLKFKTSILMRQNYQCYYSGRKFLDFGEPIFTLINPDDGWHFFNIIATLPTQSKETD